MFQWMGEKNSVGRCAIVLGRLDLQQPSRHSNPNKAALRGDEDFSDDGEAEADAEG